MCTTTWIQIYYTLQHQKETETASIATPFRNKWKSPAKTKETWVNCKSKPATLFTFESNSWTSSIKLKHESQQTGTRSVKSLSEKLASSTCKHKDRQAANWIKRQQYKKPNRSLNYKFRGLKECKTEVQ